MLMERCLLKGRPDWTEESDSSPPKAIEELWLLKIYSLKN